MRGSLLRNIVLICSLLLLQSFIASSQVTQKRTTKETVYKSQRDSIQLLYNDALARLDSITGSNIDLQSRLTARESEISTLKGKISKLLHDKDDMDADLAKAKKMITDLQKTQEQLEAELSKKEKKKP